jgi:hypothetical protein
MKIQPQDTGGEYKDKTSENKPYKNLDFICPDKCSIRDGMEECYS